MPSHEAAHFLVNIADMEPPSLAGLSLDQVNEELTFLDVMIASLDEEADDYSERYAELQAQREQYTRHADRLAAGNQKEPQTSHQADPQPDMNGLSDPPSSDSWWHNGLNGGAGSSHGYMGGIAGNGFGSRGMFENGGTGSSSKRPRQSTHLEPFEHPSKRQTPEPSGAGTPASSDGSHDFFDRDAGDRMRRQQLAAEAAARRQHEAQQADAALARELSQAGRMSSFGPRPSSGPSFQTTLNSNGSYSRPPPAMKPEPSSSAWPMLPSQPHAHPQYPSQAIKSEPGFARPQQLPQRTRPTHVVDLTGDDSDEDVSEIAPNNFTPSHRGPVPRNYNSMSSSNGFAPASHLHAPAHTTMHMPTTMQQMPGSYPAEPPNGNFVYGGASRMNGGSGSSSRPWLSSAMSGIRSMAGGLADPMSELGGLILGSSSARPLDLGDDDDISFQGSRRLGNYAGHEDLYQSRYDAFAAYDSTKTQEEIQALLQNIRPDEELPAHLRVQTPEAMSVPLHKYQELGLTWLKNCEEGSNKGGILADDMGLGKTIQMLSLMVSRKSPNPRCKTTLIVAPVALMRQWAQEIASKVKASHRLTVFTHHGTKKAKDFHDLRTYDVVLTTYGSISSEVRKMEKFEMRKRTTQDPHAQPYPSEKCIFLGQDKHWFRVILDEAQCIKNRNTLSSKGACWLQAEYRFCVTGTPMMNNVEEFYSLLKFLRIKPYCQWEKFRLDIHTPLRSAQEDTKTRAMSKLQALCKAVMLRRTKQSKFEGKPILVLPERTTTIDHPVFSEAEKEFYSALETQSRLSFNKYLRRGEIGTSYSAILVLLLRLRQACCHPHLIQDFGVAAAADLTEDSLVEFAKELSEPVIARIRETNGNFECPICYDATSNPAIFIPCGHDTCSECLARIADPANAIRSGEEGNGIRCPNCRGTIDPKRLTDFNSFKKVHMPELLTEQEREELAANGENDESDSDDDSDSSTEDDAESETEDETLNGFIVNDDEESEPEDDNKQEEDLDAEGVAGPSNAHTKGKSKSKKTKGKKKKAKGKEKSKGKGKKKEKSTVTLAELKKQASRNKAAKKKYLKRLRKNYIGSAKIDKTMEILDEIMEDREGEKVLIFSQWTSLLDLLEIPIDGKGYGYRRYDGSMSAQMRGDAVDDFRDDRKNVRIMLVSLKAGNAGLNLNMASQVIILDPFWNPYIEEQAIDRAHRFGQMRPVKVHRVLIQETVEDRIIALQEKKRALISEALDEQQAHALSRLGPQELAYLFGATNSLSDNVNYVPRSRR